MVKKAIGLAALTLAALTSASCDKKGPTAPTPPKNDFVFNVGENTYTSPEVNLAVSCASANPSDNLPDDDALNACLRQGGKIALKSGEPGYLLEKGLYVRVGVPFTTLSGPNPGNKAKIVAHPALPRAMFFADSVNGLTLENILFDGNKYQRAYAACKDFPRATNILIRGDGFRVTNVESLRAVCGSALDISGSNFVVSNNHIEDNGYDGRLGSYSKGPNPWSDGITSGHCERGLITNNIIIDSSDLGIVSGGGQGCLVENNRIYQYTQKAFGGLAVHNFTPGGMGDHTGSVFRNNIIESAPNMLDLGISVGIHYWFPNLDTLNGSVIGNTVRGAIYSLAIEGATGTYIQGNRLDGATQGDIAIVPCDDRISSDLVFGHMSKVCLQPESRLAGIVFDNGYGKCIYSGNKCTIAGQMPEECTSKSYWESQCASDTEPSLGK